MCLTKRYIAFLTGMKGCMVDALASKSDEGRGMAAISAGEMPNNRYIPRCPNEETHLLSAGTLV